MSAGATTPAPRRVSNSTTFAYAFGAAAYGIKDSGFGTFLLLFYNQVVGVAPGTVGFIIMCALVFDAFRSEEHTSELQSLMRISYAVFCLQKKNQHIIISHK